MKSLKKPASWLESRSGSISRATGIPQLGQLLRHGSVSSGSSHPRKKNSADEVRQPGDDRDGLDDDGHQPDFEAINDSEPKMSVVSLLAAFSKGSDRAKRHDSKEFEPAISATPESMPSTPALSPTASSDDSHSFEQDEHDTESESEEGKSDLEDAQNVDLLRKRNPPIFRQDTYQRPVIRHDDHVEHLDLIEHLYESQGKEQLDGEQQTPEVTTTAQGTTGAADDYADLPCSLSLGGLNASSINTLDFVESKYGKWPEGGEELLATVPAMLCRSVLIKGCLSITNKRLAFFAWLAPLLPDTDNSPLWEGTITFHYPQKWKPARRVYATLDNYGVAHYASATDRYRPIGARSISAFKSITLLPDKPSMIRAEMHTGVVREIDAETPEAARKLFNAFQTTIFRHRNKADHMAFSIPLARIVNIDHGEMIQFFRMISLHVDATKEDELSGEHDIRDIVFTVHNRCSHVLPIIDRIFEASKANQGSAIARFPSVYLDFEVSESRQKEDELQDSGDHLAEDFVREFGLVDSPDSLYITKADVVRVLPDYGRLAISDSYVCFWRKAYLTGDAKIRIPISDIEDCFPQKVLRVRAWGMSIQIRASPDQRFEFSTAKVRDAAVAALKQRLRKYQQAQEQPSSPTSERQSADSMDARSPASPLERALSLRSSDMRSARSASAQSPSEPLSPEQATALPDRTIRLPVSLLNSFPPVVNMPPVRSRIPSKRFVLMTIGSRGDVQPYIALGKRLKADGHSVTIASHEEYHKWVASHDLQFAAIGGDATALMKLSVEHKMFSPGFFAETLGKFRKWFDDLLVECWRACQNADVLVESPSTFAGIVSAAGFSETGADHDSKHIAEALAIPYFRAFTMPWTRTSDYPQAFAPMLDAGPAYNLLSYSLFDNVLWQASSSQINRWRKKVLGLRSTSLERLQTRDVPFVYNFSTAVVPKPTDWSADIHVSGYWFLDNADQEWTPCQELLDFLKKAEDDHVPVVYIGFGSITINNVDKVTQNIFEAVKNAKVRCILGKGWSARGQKGEAKKVNIDESPEDVFLVESIPHDWLFPRIAAALHHGGAGTTGASLRAGIPTLIKPFFGDQFFWASRVQKLGVGLRVASLSTTDITKALVSVTSDRVIQEKAQAAGEKIRKEDGVGSAMDFIYHLLGRTEKVAIKKHQRNTISKGSDLARIKSQASVDSNEAHKAELNKFVEQLTRAGAQTA